MSQFYILRRNNYLRSFTVYYSNNANLFDMWSMRIDAATSLNMFEAKRVVQEHKLKDYDLIKIEE